MEKITTEQWAKLKEEGRKITGYSESFFHQLYKRLQKEGLLQKTYLPDEIEAVMGEAGNCLQHLDIPNWHLSKMCLLTFLALCNIAPGGDWTKIKQVNMSLSRDIMKFVGDHFNVIYKSNTRESFRREGINILLNYGIIDLNPGNPSLGPNSPLTHYALKKQIVEKIIAMHDA